MSSGNHQIALVVIGRNEGDRLVRCLASARGLADVMVYVDSASEDRSVEHAQRSGAEVVELDMSIPFSAARARNEGWQRALSTRPNIQFVQFVDGDCELMPNWLSNALDALQKHPEVVAVCGRRKERFPERSIYNQLCDLEWNTPVGEAKAFGGDVMIRTQALKQSGGYRPDVVAGEEPELCVRLRQAGGKILRIDADMTLHDANIHSLRQWWIRAKRGGYAYALGASLHGAMPEQHWVAEKKRALVWGAGLPLAMVVVACLSPVLGAAISLAYPMQICRIGFRDRHHNPIPWTHACFLMLGKFAEAQGILRFWREQKRDVSPTIIEYK